MLLRAIKWLAGCLLRLVPGTLLGRLLPGEYGFDGGHVPDPPAVPDASIRLYVGPVNYAGQGWQWARAAERHLPDVGAVNMVVRMEADFRHPADNVVPLGYYVASQRWQSQQFKTVASGFTHVLVEAEKRPFGAVLDEGVVQQVRRLMAHGVEVAMLCHGSDIRLPSRHAALHPESPFRDSMKQLAPRYEKVALESRRVLDKLGLPVYVSTPDLLLDVPEGQWLPVVIDPRSWASESAVLERGVPVIAHAPSRGPMKGSDQIDPVLRRLESEGLVEYRRIEKVAHSDMPAVYRDADIVLDQFRVADYGVASCEAMAAGRVVIGNVSRHARDRVQERAGMELPIIQAVPSDLDAVIRRVLDYREDARIAAAQGVELVNSLHDGRSSAETLRSFLS